MKLIKLVVSSNPDKKYDAYLDVNGKERTLRVLEPSSFVRWRVISPELEMLPFGLRARFFKKS